MCTLHTICTKCVKRPATELQPAIFPLLETEEYLKCLQLSQVCDNFELNVRRWLVVCFTQSCDCDHTVCVYNFVERLL